MNNLKSIVDVYDHFFRTLHKNQIANIKAKIKKDKICPECGSNYVRKLYLAREDDFCEYKLSELPDFGEYECGDCHHAFYVEPERIWNGEVNGIKII